MEKRNSMQLSFDQACAFVEMLHKGIPSAEAFQLLTGFFCPSQNDFINPAKTRQRNRLQLVAFLRAVANILDTTNEGEI